MNRNKIVLVVEDDIIIRENLRDALEMEGYKVFTAANGKEGLEKLKLIPQPALVLLDMMMPVMNGREFLDVILADHMLAAIPVIIVSADIDESKKVGSKAYLKKPVDLDLLLQWVSRYAK
jgi:two-component system response regulator CpxR